MALFRMKPQYRKRGGVKYKGTTALGKARQYLAATSVGNYAIFCDGNKPSSICYLESYDASLILRMTQLAKVPREQGAAAAVGDYALFGGGTNADDYQRSSNVYITNSSLTTFPLQTLTTNVTLLAATTVGNYAIFGGGFSNSSSSIYTVFDNELTKVTQGWFPINAGSLAATTVGNYALFGGGYWSSTVNSSVCVYDNSLTRSIINRSIFRSAGKAATVGDYALFVGGELHSVIDVFDKSLIRSTLTKPSNTTNWYDLAAASLKNYALFGGGIESNTAKDYMFSYDNSLIKGVQTELSSARSRLAAASVGNYILFGGGLDAQNNNSDIVDVYQVA